MRIAKLGRQFGNRGRGVMVADAGPDETHLGVRHEDYAAVASCSADVRETDPGVARSTLDDGPSWLQTARRRSPRGNA